MCFCLVHNKNTSQLNLLKHVIAVKGYIFLCPLLNDCIQFFILYVFRFIFENIVFCRIILFYGYELLM